MYKKLTKEDLDRIQTDIDYFKVGDYWEFEGRRYIITRINHVRQDIVHGPIRKERRKVNFDEFIDYINNYHYTLERNVTGICEPPLITYNDFSLGSWPDSVVASYLAYSDDPNDYYYTAPENREFYVYDVDEGYVEKRPIKHTVILEGEPIYAKH